MRKERWLKIRVTERELVIVRAYAEQVDLTVSEVMREFIRSLEGKLGEDAISAEGGDDVLA